MGVCSNQVHITVNTIKVSIGTYISKMQLHDAASAIGQKKSGTVICLNKSFLIEDLALRRPDS